MIQRFIPKIQHQIFARRNFTISDDFIINFIMFKEDKLLAIDTQF